MSFNTLTHKLLYQKMNSDGMGLRATTSYNLSKKTKPFADMKGFPMLLNLSIFLHHDGSVLLLDFLLIRFSVFPPILLRNFFGQVWYLRKACTDPSLFLVYTRSKYLSFSGKYYPKEEIRVKDYPYMYLKTTCTWNKVK